MAAMQKTENDDLPQFEGLTNYIEVLMDTYPKQITRKELAQKANVSQAAITKVKDRLLELCDPRPLIFGSPSRLVLKKDEIFWKLFVFYLLQMKPTKVLLTNYGRGIISQMNIHSRIASQFKEYSLHFNEEDTKNMMEIVFYNLKHLEIVTHVKAKIADPQQRMILLTTQYAAQVENIMKKLDLPISNYEDIHMILKLRDKLFYLTKQLLWQWVVNKSRILQELSDSERATYLKVYSRTLDFYLRDLFQNITDFIKQVTERKELRFKEGYYRIGDFYKPLEENIL